MKKGTINPKNTDETCFQYEITVASNYGEIESHPERVSNMKSLINKYKWKEINYPPKTEYWKTLEKTNNSLNDSEWRKRRLSLSCSKKNYLNY